MPGFERGTAPPQPAFIRTAPQQAPPPATKNRSSVPADNPFLNPDPARIFLETDLIRGLWDAFPVSPFHALLIPRRPAPTWFQATAEEQQALTAAIATTKEIIEQECRQQGRKLPDGYNIGINAGAAAGQTVFHLHMHVIPRYTGDVDDPRGGVRHVIPSKANYLVKETPKTDYSPRGHTYTGGSSALLQAFKLDLLHAKTIDMAVAFIQESGIDALFDDLEDLLVQRKGTCRLVTGDYLDITHPNALERLLELSLHPHVHLHVRIFQTKLAKQAFHPKAYLITGSKGHVKAYVGSSNLSRPALTDSVEWNHKITQQLDPHGIGQLLEEFAKLYTSCYTTELTWDWLNEYRKRRKPLPTREGTPVEILDDPKEVAPDPHPIQKEALAALAATRSAGNQAGLVVLATGLGKTWLAAFDSEPFEKVLFVAHRDEILIQSMNTFRRIRQSSTFGFYNGQEKSPEVDVLFASIQTLGRKQHLHNFEPDSFDYIVIDEFHHAHAPTYRRLIDHFAPKFLLGLTATPERTDGGDLLAYCGQNLVYRCDLARGIIAGRLCPFRYFGVPDSIDYQNIPWHSGKFKEMDLDNALVIKARSQNVWDQYQKYAGTRTLAFCASLRHAEHMRAFFTEKGASVVAVHSGPESSSRSDSLNRLEAGELDVVFCVDMFNEGVDVKEIDTVMMLRPTESRIIWLQQLGRGLRCCKGKDHLTVIDYIGNHRSFLKKVETIWLEFGGAQLIGDADIAAALKSLVNRELTLPAGCDVKYELEAIDILEALLAKSGKLDRLQVFFKDFSEENGSRPTALEAYQAGFEPGNAARCWFEFVEANGGFSGSESEVFKQNLEFFRALDVTEMNRSYKMLVLMAMISLDAFPGELEISVLTDRVSTLAGRSQRLIADVGKHLESSKALKKMLLAQPIKAWIGGKGTGGIKYFEKVGQRFLTRELVGDATILRALTREVVEWRLAAYLDRINEIETAQRGASRRSTTSHIERSQAASEPSKNPREQKL